MAHNGPITSLHTKIIVNKELKMSAMAVAALPHPSFSDLCPLTVSNCHPTVVCPRSASNCWYLDFLKAPPLVCALRLLLSIFFPASKAISCTVWSVMVEFPCKVYDSICLLKLKYQHARFSRRLGKCSKRLFGRHMKQLVDNSAHDSSS